MKIPCFFCQDGKLFAVMRSDGSCVFLRVRDSTKGMCSRWCWAEGGSLSAVRGRAKKNKEQGWLLW